MFPRIAISIRGVATNAQNLMIASTSVDGISGNGYKAIDIVLNTNDYD